MSNKTIILSREDVNNPLYPNLFDSFLDTLGIKDKSVDEIYLQLSEVDDNFDKTGRFQQDIDGFPIREKAFYQNFCIENKLKDFWYCGFWDGYLHFEGKDSRGRYEMKCTHSDVINKNVIEMKKAGLSL